MKFLFYLLIVLVILSEIHESKKVDRRGRNRKGHKKGSCHLKEIDECLSKLEKYTKNRNSSYLLTTESGLGQICSNTMDVADCFKNYMTRCATPLQRKLYEFGREQFTKYINRFCQQGNENRTRFLQYSPCINSQVIITNNYKERCVDGFMATVDKIKDYDILDDRLDSTCCGFNRWKDCLNHLIVKQCGNDASVSMKDFLDSSFGGLTDFVCNKKEFPPKSETCNAHYAKFGIKTDAKLSDNPITKYTALYFGFLFT